MDRAITRLAEQRTTIARQEMELIAAEAEIARLARELAAARAALSVTP